MFSSCRKHFNDASPDGYSTDADKKLPAGIAFRPGDLA
jgi:hypothetical protein